MFDLSKIAGFEWDKWNIDKSYQKHGITPNQSEEVFLDSNLFFQDDIKHSEKEERFIAIGYTRIGKLLFIAFTIRVNKIRAISVRIANKKERGLYEEKIKANTKI